MDVNNIQAAAHALAAEDLVEAARLRDEVYTTHPHHSRLELDVAITNAYLDIITPTSPPEPAPDAHLDDVGD